MAANDQTASPAVAVEQPPASGPLKTPLISPAPGCTPVAHDALTPEEQTKYDWLLSQARSWTEIKATKDGKAGPVTDRERLWLTRECLLRYLRATKWNQTEAEKRLLDTLVWRRDYGVGIDEDLTPDHVSPEAETGKQWLLGFDKQARPCQYLNPGRQNTDPSPRQVQHLVFMVERVIELMPPGQETLALLINFKTSKSRSNTAPGISTGREVLHILQTHYPERLGRALIINVPWVVWGFFKLITPFIDPLTREKLKFNEDMRQYVPKEQLASEFSDGDLQFDYDHEVYWPALMKLCEERREAKRQRWEAGGKLIGEHEDYLAGGKETGAATEGSAGSADKSAVEKATEEKVVEEAAKEGEEVKAAA